MELTLTGHHVDITNALRDYVATKFERIERHFDHMTNIHCVLTVEKLIHKAEATIHMGSGAGSTLHAQAENGDMYAAIDNLADKLDRQVTKLKEKLTDHHAREVEKRYG